MLALQGNAGTASQRGIYAPCLGREHIDKAGCSRLLSMRRHQRVVSSSTELSKLVESAEEHHWEPVKRAAFLLFSICFGQVHPSRPFLKSCFSLRVVHMMSLLPFPSARASWARLPDQGRRIAPRSTLATW